MKSSSILPLTLLSLLTWATPLSAAEAKSEIRDALKKLREQPIYSWTITPKTEGSEAAGRQGTVEGKAEKDGFIWVKGSYGDTPFEAVSKGNKAVINYAGEWVAVDEDDEGTARYARRLRPLRQVLESAEELLAKSKELKKGDDGSYASELTAEGAKELFGRLGRRAAEATEAQGSGKFWVKEGVLTKFESTVKGKFTTGEEKKEVSLSRTVTVELKDIGSTKLTIPEEARSKLQN
jgi:hypothetical protein